MTRHTATYDGEHIAVTFTQTFELVDHGAGTKQFWQGLGDIEVTSLAICGVSVTTAELPESLHDGIMELEQECEWRVE